MKTQFVGDLKPGRRLVVVQFEKRFVSGHRFSDAAKGKFG
jgi:hypothetical protein